MFICVKYVFKKKHLRVSFKILTHTHMYIF